MRLLPAPRLRSIAVMPHSFEVFYAATVMRTLASTLRVTDQRDISRDATQHAYALVLAQWPDRQSRTLHDNTRYVITLAARTFTDLSCHDTLTPSRVGGEPAERPHVDEFDLHWFNIRDGLRE